MPFAMILRLRVESFFKFSCIWSPIFNTLAGIVFDIYIG